MLIDCMKFIRSRRQFIKISAKSVFSILEAEGPCSAAGSASFKGRCKIGAFSCVGERTSIFSADIGRYCSIAADVFVGPANHPTDRLSTHLFVFSGNGPFKYSKEFNSIRQAKKYVPNAVRTIIGNDVWIGRGAFIKRGVKVGDGAVIGAGAVVLNNVAPYEVVGGVPAKHLRYRFPPDTINALRETAWWNYDLSVDQLQKIDYSNVVSSVLKINNLLDSGVLKLYLPGNVIINKKSKFFNFISRLFYK